MEVLGRLPVCLGKGHVATHISSSATRLQPAHNIAFRQVLVFQTYCRLCENPSFFQHPKRLPREPQSQYIWHSDLLHGTNTLLISGGMPYANRATEGSPDHLFGAASPAFVKARIFDQNGQVVAAPVVSTVRAGGTARDVIPADLPHGTHVFQNAEFRSSVPSSS